LIWPAKRFADDSPWGFSSFPGAGSARLDRGKLNRLNGTRQKRGRTDFQSIQASSEQDQAGEFWRVFEKIITKFNTDIDKKLMEK
jgi:hypothetical protein